MKSIYEMLIEENANYTFTKYRSQWYVENIDAGYLAGSGFQTKKDAVQFMANLEKKIRNKSEEEIA